MNDFSELETELKQLRPRPISPELISRVEEALKEPSAGTVTAGVLPPRRMKFQMNWFALGFGVAAAAAFLFLARTKVDRPAATAPLLVDAARVSPLPMAQPAPTLIPDGVTRVVYQTSDEGLVFPANSNEPSRRVRSRSRETLHWKNPGSGASLRVSYPTEDVELIPVSISSQ